MDLPNLSNLMKQGGHAGLALLSVALLTQCGEKKQETKNNEASKPAAQESAAANSNEVTAAQMNSAAKKDEKYKDISEKDALFNYMLFTIGDSVSAAATQPAMIDKAREMLELIDAYYYSLSLTPANPHRVEVALRIANLRRDLTAYHRAREAYHTALTDWEAMPSGDKESLEMQRAKSNIYNGLGLTLISLKLPSEALDYFGEQLKIDQAIYDKVKPSEDTPVPEGGWPAELRTAATNLMASYRCKGDGLRLNDELEEARDVYKAGVEVVQALKNLSPEMARECVRLLIAIGNLESQVGNKEEALKTWVNAANLCRQIANNRQINTVVRNDLARYYNALLELIKTQAPTQVEGEGEKPAEDAEAAKP